MKVQKLEARIRGLSVVKTQKAAFNGGTISDGAVCIVPLEVKATKELLTTAPWSQLFPFAIEQMQTIAGREDIEKRGLDLVARGNLAEFNVEIFDGAMGTDAEFQWSLATCRGKPKLAINEKGDGTLHLKMRALMPKESMAELTIFTDADVFVSLEATQAELPLSAKEDEGEGEGESTLNLAEFKKKRRSKKDSTPQYKMTSEASALITESLRLHEALKEHELTENVRRIAKLRAGDDAKITITVDDVTDAVSAMVPAPLAAE